MGHYPKIMMAGREALVFNSYPEEAAVIKKIKQLQSVLYEGPQ